MWNKLLFYWFVRWFIWNIWSFFYSEHDSFKIWWSCFLLRIFAWQFRWRIIWFYLSTLWCTWNTTLFVLFMSCFTWNTLKFIFICLFVCTTITWNLQKNNIMWFIYIMMYQNHIVTKLMYILIYVKYNKTHAIFFAFIHTSWFTWNTLLLYLFHIKISVK